MHLAGGPLGWRATWAPVKRQFCARLHSPLPARDSGAACLESVQEWAFLFRTCGRFWCTFWGSAKILLIWERQVLTLPRSFPKETSSFDWKNRFNKLLRLEAVTSASKGNWFRLWRENASCLVIYGASVVAQMVKRLPAMQETWVGSLGQEDPLQKEMATHSSTLAWKIPWTEEPGGLQSMGSQRVEHDWATSLTLLLSVTAISDFWPPNMNLQLQSTGCCYPSPPLIAEELGECKVNKETQPPPPLPTRRPP